MGGTADGVCVGNKCPDVAPTIVEFMPTTCLQRLSWPRAIRDQEPREVMYVACPEIHSRESGSQD